MNMRTFLIILAVAVVPAQIACNLGDNDSGSSGQVTVTAPSELAATISTDNISFTWKDNSDNETSFVLYIKPFGETSWYLYDNGIPANVTNYSLARNTLTGLNFQFCLTAYNGTNGVESGASNIVSVSLP